MQWRRSRSTLSPYTTLFRSLPAPLGPEVRRVDHFQPDARGEELRSASVGLEVVDRSEEHTSELQSLAYLVCRLLLEKHDDDIVAVHPRVQAPSAHARVVEHP